MSKKGGYLIIDLNGVNILTKGNLTQRIATIDTNIYQQIEQNYNKRVVVSGVKIDNIECNDFEVYQPKHLSNINIYNIHIDGAYVLSSKNTQIYIFDKIYEYGEDEDKITFNCYATTWPIYKEYKVSKSTEKINLSPFNANDLITVNFHGTKTLEQKEVYYSTTISLTQANVLATFYVSLPKIFEDETIAYALINIDIENSQVGIDLFNSEGSTISTNITYSITCIKNLSIDF